MSENSSLPDQTRQSFITPELTHRIELILHLLEHSDQLIIVKGDGGSGKTTLLNELIKQEITTLDIKAISITESFCFEQFELSLWAAGVRNEQKVPALLIDDIDRAHQNELNSLRALIDDKEKIRFCLFCLPTFTETLEQTLSETSASNELHIVDIPPLNEDQALLYIRNRYAHDPYKSSQFNGVLALQIYQFNYGLPGKINAYCDQYLTDPASISGIKKLDKIKLPKNKTLVSAIAMFSIFILLIFIAVSDKTEQESKKIKIKLDVPIREATVIDVSETPTQDIFESVESPVGEEKAQASAEIDQGVKDEKSISVLEPSSIPEDIIPPEILWLNEQDPENYVLQLLGAQELKTIELYKNSFADPDGQLRVITTLKEGKQWYILIYGLYETREKAKLSTRGLPARAKQLSPWPRTISSIKNQLN